MTIYAVPGSTAVTEGLSRVNGFIQGCGQAGVLVMSHILRGTPVSPGQLTGLIEQSVRSGHAVSSGGATTLSQLQWLAATQGVPTQVMDWRQSLRFTGLLPVELGVSNASALGGNDVGVRGHYIDILGFNSQHGTFLAADPNQPAARQGMLVEYTPQQLRAADPFGALVPDLSALLGQLTTQAQTAHQAPANQLLAWGGGPGAVSASPTAANIGPTTASLPLPVMPGLAPAVTQTGSAVASTLNIGQRVQQVLAALEGAAVRAGLISIGVLLLFIVVIMLLVGPSDSTRRQVATVAARRAIR